MVQAPGCATENPGLAPARPGVHSADMNEPAVNVPRGDCWNAASLVCSAGAGLMSAPWTPATCQTSSLRASPLPGPPACPGFPPERVSQKS